MGQKVHPLGVRLGKFLKWNNEWYSGNKTNNAKLVYYVYVLKYLLISYLYKKELLVHSFSSKYVDSNLLLTVNVVSTFKNYKYFSLKFLNKYYNKLFIRLKFLTKLFIENFNLKTNLIILKKFFILKKISYKYSSIPTFNSLNYLKNFSKLNYLDIVFPLSNKNYQFFSDAIFLFQKFPNIIITVKSLSQCQYISNEFFQKKIKNNNFNLWFYYFYIMNQTFPSSLLIGGFLKKILETRSLKKKQRFFFNSLRRFLNGFKNKSVFSKIKGLKIHIKGRLNGRNRSSLYKIQIGSIPLSTLSQKIDYSFFPAFTVYGSFGIKVWIAFKK